MTEIETERERESVRKIKYTINDIEFLIISRQVLDGGVNLKKIRLVGGDSDLHLSRAGGQVRSKTYVTITSPIFPL